MSFLGKLFGGKKNAAAPPPPPAPAEPKPLTNLEKAEKAARNAKEKLNNYANGPFGAPEGLSAAAKAAANAVEIHAAWSEAMPPVVAPALVPAAAAVVEPLANLKEAEKAAQIAQGKLNIHNPFGSFNGNKKAVNRTAAAVEQQADWYAAMKLRRSLRRHRSLRHSSRRNRSRRSVN